MRLAPLLTVLLSFSSSLALAGAALAQEAPPVSDPAAGQRAPDAPAITAPPAQPPVAPPVDPIPAVWAPVPVDAQGHSAYGFYLAGRNMVGRSSVGDTDAMVGAQALAQAERLTPEQPSLREQAFTASLLAGDLDEAVRISPQGPGVSPVISEAGRLVSAVQSFAHGDAREASAALKSHPVGAPHAVAALLAQPWIAAAAGDWDFALTPTPAGATDGLNQIRRFQRAQLLEVHHQDAEAEAEFRAMAVSPLAQPGFPLGYGGFLERRHRYDEAIAVYDAALAGNADNEALLRAKARAVAHGPAPALPTFRQGAQGGLVLAASQAVDQGAIEFATVYLRLALNVQPGDDVRLLLGSVLARAKLEAASRAALAEIGPDNAPAYAAARLQIGASLNRDDRKTEALDEFRKAVAAAPDAPDAYYSLAAQLIDLHRYDEALAILNAPPLATAAVAEIHYIRGAAYESVGKIAEAEAELWAALQLQPDEPTFLNYLGYLWVDTGSRVTEGAAMIAQARAAAPDDGNIQDSQGWAQYRQGLYPDAVVTLEEAVTKEPANPEINDHLGDAYWQVGRRREAGYQWNRVLTLDPDAERRADVEKKLADGLSPSPPVTPAPVTPAPSVPATTR